MSKAIPITHPTVAQANGKPKKLEAQQWLDKAQAFERAYPSPEEQQAKINEICRNRFNPTQIVGRIFAISEWWKTIECQQAKVATC
jgi:hypothetical protein